MTTYQDFIASKSQVGGESGFSPVFLPDFLFDFQKSLVEWAVRKGRAAIFADTGLGKTAMQLTWAENVCRKTGGKVLIAAPLAVSGQTVREASKFGFDCIVSKDGTTGPRITVTNYERLHYFDAEDFAGMVGDESSCFPPDTLVDTVGLDKSLISMYIKDIQPGDRILNASGVDHVQARWKRRINRAVRITAGTKSFTCSDNHPFFTLHGWRRADDLQPGDFLVETGAAMCLVRDEVLSEIFRARDAAFLRSILLGEMEDEAARYSSQGPQPGDVQEDQARESFVACLSDRATETRYSPAASRSQSVGGIRRAGEDFSEPSSHRTPAITTRREWNWDDQPAAAPAGDATEGMDAGICRDAWDQDGGLSDELQAGSWQPHIKNRYRVGWAQTPQPNFSGEGRKEGSMLGLVGVDRVEVLELGHADLDQYRDENGHVYFYDLQATRHPSFSVNGILVHNCIKAFDGKRRKEVTRFLSKMQYRLLCTATAAPNDFIELGTASEALGELSQSDMLGMFFKASDNMRHSLFKEGDFWNRPKWFFRPHAELPFWRWVCSWARAIRKPSDLGFDDSRFILPALNVTQTVIPTTFRFEGELFVRIAKTLKEQREERKRTIQERCERAAALVSHDQPAVVWCQYNREGDMLEEMILDSIQVAGCDTDEDKEDRLLAFSFGKARVLITKPRIASRGLNWQHCAHQTFFPSHSFEDYYQAVRRSWRFGQTRPVQVDVIATEGEAGVTANLQKKQRKADQMFEALVSEMHKAEGVQSTDRHMRVMEAVPWL